MRGASLHLGGRIRRENFTEFVRLANEAAQHPSTTATTSGWPNENLIVVDAKELVLPHPPCQRGAVLVSFCMSEICMSSTDISAMYRDFTNALADVLAENAVGLASRGRLARTRAAVKNHL